MTTGSIDVSSEQNETMAMSDESQIVNIAQVKNNAAQPVSDVNHTADQEQGTVIVTSLHDNTGQIF